MTLGDLQAFPNGIFSYSCGCEVVDKISSDNASRGPSAIPELMNKLDVLHVRLTDLHAAQQNLPFRPNRTVPLKQYQYQGRL